MQLNCIMSQNHQSSNSSVIKVEPCEAILNGDTSQSSHSSDDIPKKDKSTSDNLLYPGTSVVDRGRLKFFFGGKIILELSHQPEGDNRKWVQVTDKTYWPPLKHVNPKRQGSSASQSVSDDGSSVQSSPWQRDHRWKQVNPKKHLSYGIDFMMHTNKHISLIRYKLLAAITKHKLRRSPFLKMEVHHNIVNNYQKISYRKISTCRKNIGSYIDILRKKVTNNVIAPSKDSSEHCSKSVTEVKHKLHSMISPRKRILREIEKDELQSKQIVSCENTDMNYLVSQCKKEFSKARDYSIDSLLNRESVSSPFLRSILAADETASKSDMGYVYLPHSESVMFNVPQMHYNNAMDESIPKSSVLSSGRCNQSVMNPSENILSHKANIDFQQVAPIVFNFSKSPSQLFPRSQVSNVNPKIALGSNHTLPFYPIPVQDAPLNLSLHPKNYQKEG